MSHFARNTQMVFKDVKILQQAMIAMGYGLTIANQEKLHARGFSGRTTAVDAMVTFSTRGNYDIGFVREDNGYTAVADWWGIHKERSLMEQPFLAQTMKEYVFIAAVETMPRGFSERRRYETQDEHVLVLQSY